MLVSLQIKKEMASSKVHRRLALSCADADKISAAHSSSVMKYTLCLELTRTQTYEALFNRTHSDSKNVNIHPGRARSGADVPNSRLS